MKIAIFCTIPKDTYSGGRYHALMIAEALALSGHEVHFITNCEPIFVHDFSVFHHHSDIRMCIAENFETGIPSGDFDIVLLVPGAHDPRFYLWARYFSWQRGAHLVLLNFESGNWFNSLSPVKADLSRWTHWRRAAKHSSLVLSLTEEGSRFAREFYRGVYPWTQFDFCYPAINIEAAKGAGDWKPEKRVLVFGRYEGEGHKGVLGLESLIGSEMSGYTLVIILGRGGMPDSIHESLVEVCKAHNVGLELKRRLSDHDKFVELKRASLMLFPSYFEGYGYPPIEALYCGLACVAFDLPVLRETCGDQLIYAKHGDWVDFRLKMNEALLNPGAARINAMERIEAVASLAASAHTLDKLFARLDSGQLPASAWRAFHMFMITLELRLRDPERYILPKRIVGALRRWLKGSRIKG